MSEVIGRRTSELLEQLGMSQKELAKRMGVSEVTISRYINDVYTPRTELLDKMAEVLNTNADYLLGKTDVRDPYPQSSFQQTMNFVKDIVLNHEKNKNFKPVDEELDNRLLEILATRTDEENQKTFELMRKINTLSNEDKQFVEEMVDKLRKKL